MSRTKTRQEKRKRKPKSLTELSFALSADMEALDFRCAAERGELDKQREELLSGIPAAGKVLKRYHLAIQRAKKTKIDFGLRAERDRDRTVRFAEDKRRRLLSDWELRYRRKRDAAYRAKRAAHKKARDKWTRTLKKIAKHPLEEQRGLRREADDAYEQQLQDASDTFTRVTKTARIEHKAALQDALIDERLAVEQAHRQAEKDTTAAAIEYERAIANEEADLRTSLREFPAAEKIQSRHDRELAESRDRCEKDKEALFREFSRARRQLNA